MFLEGIYPIYKPSGITSFKIISLVRKKSGIKRVGHGGTLDPFADGVLVVAVGRKFTKKLTEILKNSEKEYVAEIILNQKSDTYDITGNITNLTIDKIPTKKEIESVLSNFVGEIMQSPPPYSAIKIGGIRACDLIRKKNFDVEKLKTLIKPKKVVIKKIEILEYQYPFLKLKIVCMSGVYIRSLANDLGEKLSCGGILKSLTRTKVANFTINDCIKIVGN